MQLTVLFFLLCCWWHLTRNSIHLETTPGSQASTVQLCTCYLISLSSNFPSCQVAVNIKSSVFLSDLNKQSALLVYDLVHGCKFIDEDKLLVPETEHCDPSPLASLPFRSAGERHKVTARFHYILNGDPGLWVTSIPAADRSLPLRSS